MLFWTGLDTRDFTHELTRFQLNGSKTDTKNIDANRHWHDNKQCPRTAAIQPGPRLPQTIPVPEVCLQCDTTQPKR